MDKERDMKGLFDLMMKGMEATSKMKDMENNPTEGQTTVRKPIDYDVKSYLVKGMVPTPTVVTMLSTISMALSAEIPHFMIGMKVQGIMTDIIKSIDIEQVVDNNIISSCLECKDTLKLAETKAKARHGSKFNF